jgi:hypothetical protein
MLVLTAAPKDPAKLEFNRDIRPILSDKCFSCHGPDERSRKAGLRLDTLEGATKQRGKTQPIVPGDPVSSRILTRIHEPKEALRMPPPAAGPRLSEKESATLETWIRQGAEYQQHWAFLPPQRPAVPPAAAWARNPVDNFVLARLTAEGLKTSPAASKAALLRRVSFDLTGLPPTPAEIDTFLKDKSPDAYDKQVDRLLASPRYGERMAMLWLDLARYADTHGFHIDSHRDMWPWRDWVIRAFNGNKSYKEFIVEQLAGDLLPNPSRDQLIATGFNRNHMINFEGGAIPEEYLAEYVADRVETTSTVFLGLTTGCARCHDHKYDPIRQKDFYRLFAFYNSVPEKGLDGRTGNAQPFLRLTEGDQDQQLADLQARLTAADKALPLEEIRCQMDTWEALRQPKHAPPSNDGLVAHFELDGHLADTSGRYQHGVARGAQVSYNEGVIGRQVYLNGETALDFPQALDFERDQPFALSLYFNSVVSWAGQWMQRISDATERRGIELIWDSSHALGDLQRGAYLRVRLTHSWPDNAIEIRTKRPVVFRKTHHFALSYNGSSKAAGIQLFLNGLPLEVEIVKDSLTGSIRTSAPLTIANGSLGLPPYNGSLDDLRIYNRPLTVSEVENLGQHYPAEYTLTLPRNQRSPARFDLLKTYWLEREAPPEWAARHQLVLRLRQEKKDLEARIPSVMVMSQMDQPRPTHVLMRGDYRNLGEPVTPGVPAFLPQLDPKLPANRLALAYWITSPDNPLTARVAVNRFWAAVFGTGLVKTLEDFGSQGEPPSHPGLLDWLATEFVNTGWDVKRLMRIMVTSATYQQASAMNPGIVERDPQNRLLSHGPRFRLPAEMIRDQALAVSGLLVEKVGGPSVRIYQPPNIWEELAFGGEYSAQTYEQDHGQALYRRGIYIFAKRTAPHPALITFDAPDREKCTARRLTTNTPLQALVLMNDPQYLEASRVLAQRLLALPDTTARLDFGFRLATSRPPSVKERQILRDLAERLEQRFRKDPEAALKLLEAGEAPRPNTDPPTLAALTMVASTLLNLDETVTKQ